MKALPSQLPIFIQVAKTGSFAQAARNMGISAPAVSKAIGKLEEEWEVKLFYRSSHSLSLTQVGEQLFEQLTPSVETIQHTIAQVTEDSQKATGKIKMNLPASSIGQDIILPLIIKFMDHHPEISVDLHFDDRSVDLVEHGFDIGIGTSINEDSRLIARQVFSTGVGVYAAPSYLEHHGEPHSLEDLTQHHCIPVRSVTTGRFHGWRLSDGEKSLLHVPKGKLIVNSFSAAKAAVVNGAGIGCLGQWMFEQEIKTRQVVPILKEHWGEAIPVWLYYSSRQFLPVRIRLLIDYLVAELSQKS